MGDKISVTKLLKKDLKSFSISVSTHERCPSSITSALFDPEEYLEWKENLQCKIRKTYTSLPKVMELVLSERESSKTSLKCSSSILLQENFCSSEIKNFGPDTQNTR
jgi:hypothetical protein